MEIKKIDGTLFKTLVLNGAENLRINYKQIDELNVFPVPDGDTGTNMLLTTESGVNEIKDSDDISIFQQARKLSRGMLMGARGNSGVILSQLFRGISKGFSELDEVDALGLAKAFDAGVKQAYKAVVKPVEGTILTVAREASEKMLLISSSRMSINEFFREYTKEAEASLERTPNLLPILKDSGVVDSGGAGFLCIVKGMLKALEGEFLTTEVSFTKSPSADQNAYSQTTKQEYGYCTEFIVMLDQKKFDLKDFDEQKITKRLEEIGGSSMVVVRDEDLLKVHVHTLTPGKALNIGQEYGEFLKLKIENMQIQHNEMVLVKEKKAKTEEPKPVMPPRERVKTAVVAVASGEGISKTFEEMGCDYIVSGGQSMNPSTEDFIKAYDSLNSDNIFVFPNNKNIILAAEQSAHIYKESKIWVVPTKSLAQGFSALTMLDLEEDPETVIENLKEVITKVTTVQVTYSIRDTEINGINIKKNDYIGIIDGNLVYASKKSNDALKQTLKQAIKEDSELVTLIYGKNVSERDVNDVQKFIEKNFDIDIEVINGTQDVYDYILAIE